MNPQTRRIALYAIGVVAVLGSGNALVHSYAGLYSWAVQHRVSGWQAMTWPAEIDVFLVLGELALYVAYLDGWPVRQRLWPWVTAVTGLVISVAGNVGHVISVAGTPVTLADRVTAAVSPVAAFAGLMIGLLALKMNGVGNRQIAPTTTVRFVPAIESDSPDTSEDSCSSLLVVEASRVLRTATNGGHMSQRALAAELRKRGHRFSNAQLRDLAQAAQASNVRNAA